MKEVVWLTHIRIRIWSLLSLLVRLLPPSLRQFHSLLTCLRPTSSSPLIAKVQEPSATLPLSALHATFPSPVLPSFDVFPSCFYIPYSCPCRLWCVLVTLGLTRSSIESLNPKALPLPRKVGEIGYLLTYAAAFAKSGHGTGDVEDNLSMLSPPIPGFAFFFLFLGLTISPLYSCDCTFSSLWKYSGLVSHCSC